MNVGLFCGNISLFWVNTENRGDVSLAKMRKREEISLLRKWTSFSVHTDLFLRESRFFWYGVATISRLLKIGGLFCRI